MDCTDKEACDFAGISEKTLYNYQNTHPEFLQEKRQWKVDLILKARIAVSERLEKDGWFALRYLCKKLPNEFHTPRRGLYRPPAESSEGLRATLEKTDKLLEKYGV